MTTIQYGLVNKAHLIDIVDKVVEALGGGEPAKALLMETAAAETGIGVIKDTTPNVGMGLMQFDRIGFDDVKLRTTKANKDATLRMLGVDIMGVQYEDLRFNPFLSVIFARLKYKLVPSAIPATIEGRAAYWKKWYNSSLGKGTTQSYLTSAARYGVA